MSSEVFNGEFVEKGKTFFDAGNRAFRYGDALFETVRVMNGKPLFVQDHLERLTEGMKYLRMNIPAEFNLHYFYNIFQELSNRNEIKTGGRIRMEVFRTGGGHYAPLQHSVEYIIQCEPMDENFYSLNEKGWMINLFNGEKKNCSGLSNLKSSSALLYVIAGIFRDENSLDEVILINEKENICEGLNSNIFILKNDTVITNTTKDGIIPGIMRKHILALLKENKIRVEEKSISSGDLQQATEIFFTNVVHGIRWASGFGKQRYFNNLSKQLVTLLNKKVQ